MISVVPSEHRFDLAASVGGRVAESPVGAAQSAPAGNSLDKVLCHQLAAIHRAAMKLVARSLDMYDHPVEAARLSNAAERAMQLYQEGLLTLQKLRTGGRQTVVEPNPHVR